MFGWKRKSKPESPVWNIPAENVLEVKILHDAFRKEETYETLYNLWSRVRQIVPELPTDISLKIVHTYIEAHVMEEK